MKAFSWNGHQFFADVAQTYVPLHATQSEITYLSLWGFSKDIKNLLRRLTRIRASFEFSDDFIYSRERNSFMTEYIGDLGHILFYHTFSRSPKSAYRQQAYLFIYDTRTYTSPQIQAGAVSESFMKQLYEQIREHVYTPCLPDWIPYLLREDVFYAETTFDHTPHPDNQIYTYVLSYNEAEFQDAVRRGLRQKQITMGQTAKCSEKLHQVRNLDDYLSAFSKELEQKINDTYHPLFDYRAEPYDPAVRQFDTHVTLRRDIQLLPGQKNLVNAVVRRLDRDYSALVCAGMGSGKTLISISSVYAHATKHHKEYVSSIVLCPGHLVEKWQRELEDSYPCAQVLICQSAGQFMYDIEPLLRQPNRRTNLFIVMSKDTAKGAFDMEPAVLYDPIYTKKAHAVAAVSKKNVGYYRCPHCGCLLTASPKKKGDPPESGSIYFFARQNSRGQFQNLRCDGCGEVLWQPSLGKRSSWLKIPNFGWVHKEVMKQVYDTVQAHPDIPYRTQEDRTLAIASIQWHNGENDFLPAESRRMSLAKYIYRNYRNKIDYLIADEMHQFSASDSIQAAMFALMVRTAKHTIGLTGTLMNGYASNLFYLLFRMFPKAMIRNGYSYDDQSKFSAKYGVSESTQKTSSSGGKRTTTKQRPGISPVVFTNFLLDSCVFLNLEYTAPYTEIPVAVEMPESIASEYDRIRNRARSLILENVEDKSKDFTFSKMGARMLNQVAQLLTIFPDQPYQQPPIYNYDKQETVYQPADAATPEDLLPKEEKALEIAREAVARGEHVLLYTYWTNRTDVQEKLKKLFDEHDLPADILSASVEPKRRESWIRNRVRSGMKVLICNPTLVETGLDLLDFTTIVFYQLGYKLTTMRQASKRSYRLNQKNPVHVYFLYYQKTTQEQALAIMALKLHAATALEGKFDAEGLAALNSDETDILSQLAKSIVDDQNSLTVDTDNFVDTNTEQITFISTETPEETRIPDTFQETKYLKRNREQQKFLPAMVSW